MKFGSARHCTQRWHANMRHASTTARLPSFSRQFEWHSPADISSGERGEGGGGMGAGDAGCGNSGGDFGGGEGILGRAGGDGGGDGTEHALSTMAAVPPKSTCNEKACVMGEMARMSSFPLPSMLVRLQFFRALGLRLNPPAFSNESARRLIANGEPPCPFITMLSIAERCF
jgi:hypothetical protein